MHSHYNTALNYIISYLFPQDLNLIYCKRVDLLWETVKSYIVQEIPSLFVTEVGRCVKKKQRAVEQKGPSHG